MFWNHKFKHSLSGHSKNTHSAFKLPERTENKSAQIISMISRLITNRSLGALRAQTSSFAPFGRSGHFWPLLTILDPFDYFRPCLTICLQNFFLVILVPADLWYHTWFPRSRILTLFVTDGRTQKLGILRVRCKKNIFDSPRIFQLEKKNKQFERNIADTFISFNVPGIFWLQNISTYWAEYFCLTIIWLKNSIACFDCTTFQCVECNIDSKSVIKLTNKNIPSSSPLDVWYKMKNL